MNKFVLGCYIALILFTILIGIGAIAEIYNDNKLFYSQKELTVEQQNCNHEFVVLNSYLGGRGRIYSKCIKFGMKNQKLSQH